ncbi:MAG: MipA/OmpV family protein [Acetobacter sp.]|jgi:outer membrane scaffolding protein for murein synthesis (MipA/OmpV family)|nr:MipA/OmpV family protein [Acetobacter sp.]MCH4061311.1 MipA/OmpV family protein [Acetobacter sp.]MCH4088248.1 MipA/OmpV family protein [Acetobacter sp.]
MVRITHSLSHRLDQQGVLSNHKIRVTSAAVFATIIFSKTAIAEDKNRNWTAWIAPAAIVRPTYEGSDHYRVVPGATGNFTYRDFISLGNQGANMYWHYEGLRIGGGLNYKGKRKDNGSNNLVTEGDSRLHGMGNVRASVGLRAFATYDLGPISFAADFIKYEGDDNKGININFGAFAPLKLSRSITLTPRIGATWANHNYMQTYFGVTDVQSARSNFDKYTPGSGFKNVDFGVSTSYKITNHWFIANDTSLHELLGDARHSPITFSKTNVMSIFMVGYKF